MVSRVGVGFGELRVQSWNCNSLKKKHGSWTQFISKLKNSNENIFILVDTRFGPKQEKDFEKLWDGPIFFNSFNSSQRGLMVLFRDALPAKNIVMENKLKGDFSDCPWNGEAQKSLSSAVMRRTMIVQQLIPRMRIIPVGSLGRCLMTAMMMDMMLL